MKENDINKFIRKIQKSAVEKAIEYFNRRLFESNGYPIDKEYTETAVKALYKANKLTPIPSGKYRFKCPSCKEELGIEREDISVYDMTPPNFCEKCGQAFDWGDYE